MNKIVSVTLPVEMIDRLDNDRGYYTRSQYVRLLIDKAYASECESDGIVKLFE